MATQYSCLENAMDKGATWTTVHGGHRVRLELATKPPPLSQSRYKKKKMMSLMMRGNQWIAGTEGIDRGFCDILKLHSWSS